MLARGASPRGRIQASQFPQGAQSTTPCPILTRLHNRPAPPAPERTRAETRVATPIRRPTTSWVGRREARCVGHYGSGCNNTGRARTCSITEDGIRTAGECPRSGGRCIRTRSRTSCERSARHGSWRPYQARREATAALVATLATDPRSRSGADWSGGPGREACTSANGKSGQAAARLGTMGTESLAGGLGLEALGDFRESDDLPTQIRPHHVRPSPVSMSR